MRLLITIVLVICALALPAQPKASIMVHEQSQAYALLAPYLATTPNQPINTSGLDSFLDKLSRKRPSTKNDVQFLHFIFTRVHQAYLQRYREHTPFSSIFTEGAYNCLTGTILFSSVFDYFGIAHEIIETNYHIFILAQSSQGAVLIETTDAFNGFITDAETIDTRVAQYKNNELQPVDNSRVQYRYTFNLYNSVAQHELVGLLYYNLAVDAFNQQRIADATAYLHLAGERYISPRVEEFSTLLLVAVHESQLLREEKVKLKKILQTIRYKAMPAMAGL